MASPAPGVQGQPAAVGEKRKREADETDSKDEYKQDEGNSTVDPNSVVPDDYELQDSDDDDDQLSDEDEENVIEEVSEIPTHDESKEPFPKCAIYDADIKKIEEKIAVIPKRVLRQLEEHGCLGQALKVHISRAEKLMTLPQTPKMRIAILGCAGVGKSSLLNAITGKADLAKSLSGGQSCTCVPTEYQDAFTNQSLDFAAKFYYLQPDGVVVQLRETIKDYNTFTFEAQDDWDEDTRMSAKKAHANAMKVLRTLFNDNPNFTSKNATVGYMSAMHTQQELLLDELAANCELKLKHTAAKDYTDYHEAKTLAKLRSRIDPLMSSTGIFDEPSLWPLLRHVSIGVRASRVLENVTLIDLPGISDTNQSRVELTHDFIGSCDYIWIVAPISRAVDDATVFQLLSRYGKHFKGILCVICTHSDDGIIASETKLVNYFRQEDQDVTQYVALSDRMKAKKPEITALKAQIAQVKKKKKKATKQQMLDVREEEEALKGLTREFARLEAERFGFLVQTRNALITEQMQDAMQSHLPLGHVLEVHCISNSHYAALNRAGIRGPRLTAEATGVPRLRANTIALVAPKLLNTLEQYVTYDVKYMLEQLQLWLSTASIDRRVELLALASQPREQLPAMVDVRLAGLATDVRTMAEVTLQQAIPEASRAALEQLARKEAKHWKTIAAFIRNDGNYATKMCLKESWNENFMKSLTDLIIGSLGSLGQTRAQLTEALESGIIENLNKFRKTIEDFPANLPKDQLASSLETCVRGIRHNFATDAAEYDKDNRKLLLDISQDDGRNPFTKKMRPVYEACREDKGTGVTKRSIDRIREVLSDTGPKSPYASLSRGISRWLNSSDRKHIGDIVGESVVLILDQVYESMDNLLNEKVENEAEVAARLYLQRFLPIHMTHRDQGDKDLQAVMARYGLQLKFGQPQAEVRMRQA